MQTPPANMTHEELERWHYANGDTVLAQCHSLAAEGEAAQDEAEEREAEAYRDGYDDGYAKKRAKR